MFEYWSEIDPSFCPDNRLPEDMRVFRLANTKHAGRMHFLIDMDEFEWYFGTE